MKVYFGLNTILHVEVIDSQVGYVQDLYMDVHKLVVSPIIEGHTPKYETFCDFHGERIYFKNFDEVATMDKRKLLALKKITVILS